MGVATALYRRYRPESFAEVIGQDHVTTPLRRALNAGRIGHAYLFSGPRGCGKTTSARILARCLNCAEGPTDTPCGECDSCRDLARDGAGSLDVVEIDAASHGGVDDARELRERASFAPVRDRFKVFIIDEAHMVTSAGFNALLKLVEEPPEHVKFVFATTEPDKVIGTIRSRTHHYPFRLIPPQVLSPYLREVCDAEQVPVGDGVLPLVVRAGGGSARDSMSVLDQLMAGAGEDGLDFPTAIALLGFTDTALLDRAVEAIAQRDAAALYGAVEEVISTGHEPRRFVEDLLERIRDLIVLAAVPDRGGDLLPHIPAGDLERMTAQASTFAPADLSTAGELVHETLSTMNGATSPRVHLELLAARLVLRDEAGAQAAGSAPQAPAAAPTQPAPGGSGRDEARRIAQEKAEAARQARGVRAPSQPPPERPEQPHRNQPAPQRPEQQRPAEEQPAPAAAQQPDPQPAPQQPSAGGSGLDADEVRGHWSAILDELAQIRRPSWALLSQNAHVHGAQGSTLLLGFRTGGLLAAFRRGTAAENLAEAVHRIMRVKVTVDAVVGEDPGPGGGASGGGPGSAPSGGPAPAPQQADAPQSGSPRAEESGGSGPAASTARDRASQSWGDVEVATLGGARTQASERSAQPRPQQRAERTAPAQEDFAPEPDDPYPPDPDDSSWGPGPSTAAARVPAARPAQVEAPPATPDHEPASAGRGPASADRVPASADRGPAPPAPPAGEDIPVVEDEGRDSLPEGEPRTYGQAALRRAIAEGRVVHSKPAESTAQPTGEPAAASVVASVTAAQPAPAAPEPESEPAPQRPRSGADLAREAAHASRHAGRRFGVVKGKQAAPGEADGADEPDDDPTGGATRDDEDAEYTRRSGREVIESVLGGKVLEVIEERPDY